MRPVNLAVFMAAIPLHITRNIAAWYFSLSIRCNTFFCIKQSLKYILKQNIAFYFLFLIKILLLDWGEDLFLQLNTYAHLTFNIIYIYITAKDHFYDTIYPAKDRVFLVLSYVTYIALWHTSR